MKGDLSLVPYRKLKSPFIEHELELFFLIDSLIIVWPPFELKLDNNFSN